MTASWTPGGARSSPGAAVSADRRTGSPGEPTAGGQQGSLSAADPGSFSNKWLPGENILGVFEQKASKSSNRSLIPQDQRALPGLGRRWLSPGAAGAAHCGRRSPVPVGEPRATPSTAPGSLPRRRPRARPRVPAASLRAAGGGPAGRRLRPPRTCRGPAPARGGGRGRWRPCPACARSPPVPQEEQEAPGRIQPRYHMTQQPLPAGWVHPAPRREGETCNEASAPRLPLSPPSSRPAPRPHCGSAAGAAGAASAALPAGAPRSPPCAAAPALPPPPPAGVLCSHGWSPPWPISWAASWLAARAPTTAAARTCPSASPTGDPSSWDCPRTRWSAPRTTSPAPSSSSARTPGACPGPRATRSEYAAASRWSAAEPLPALPGAPAAKGGDAEGAPAVPEAGERSPGPARRERRGEGAGGGERHPRRCVSGPGRGSAPGWLLPGSARVRISCPWMSPREWPVPASAKDAQGQHRAPLPAVTAPGEQGPRMGHPPGTEQPSRSLTLE